MSIPYAINDLEELAMVAVGPKQHTTFACGPSPEARQ